MLPKKRGGKTTPATDRVVETMKRSQRLVELATVVQTERTNIQASLDDFSARYKSLNESLNGPLMEELLGKKKEDSQVGVSIIGLRRQLKTLKEEVGSIEKSANEDKKNFDTARSNTRSARQFDKADKAVANLKTYKAKIDEEVRKLEDLRKSVQLFARHSF